MLYGPPGGSQVFGAASGGKVRRFTTLDDATPVMVLPSNPQRRSLTFHNPGAEDVFVFPAVDATGAPLTSSVTVGSPGGAFRVYGNGGTLTLNGEIADAWYALAAAGSGNPFTSMESNA